MLLPNIPMVDKLRLFEEFYLAENPLADLSRTDDRYTNSKTQYHFECFIKIMAKAYSYCNIELLANYYISAGTMGFGDTTEYYAAPDANDRVINELKRYGINWTQSKPPRL